MEIILALLISAKGTIMKKPNLYRFKSWLGLLPASYIRVGYLLPNNCRSTTHEKRHTEHDKDKTDRGSSDADDSRDLLPADD